jgi:hypothetical protein
MPRAAILTTAGIFSYSFNVFEELKIRRNSLNDPIGFVKLGEGGRVLGYREIG